MTRAAAARVRPRAPDLAVATTPLAADVDAMALLRAVPARHRVLIERPDAGLAIAGVGEALALGDAGAAPPSEPGRFAALAASLAALPEDAIALGGFAFDDAAAAPGGAWRGFPAAAWFVPRLAIVRRDGHVRLVAAGPAAADLTGALRHGLAALARAAGPPAHPRPPRRWRLAALRAPAAWCRAVERTLADIGAGRLSKLVLARAVRIDADAPLDPLAAAHRLRRAYPGCTTFAVGFGDATFVGATPERLVRADGVRLQTAAVAGTAPRGATPDVDRMLATELLASPKERAEHALVADELRARLVALCDHLEVPAGPSVLVTETVQHLHTPISATLRPGRHLLDVVEALHPTPAICGAPRAEALALLRRRERLDRGWYGGGIGWCDAAGGEVSVAIRTALVRGSRALLHAGAGIVAGSSAERELAETRLKLRPLLGALLEL